MRTKSKMWFLVLISLIVSAVIALAGLGQPAFAEARVRADFDGDGFDDLAVGVPFEYIRSIFNAGAVNVIYGSAGGLASAGNQFWNQNSSGILDSAESSDEFGYSLTSGDFNGDGYHDLAVGVPFEAIGSIGSAGAVNVIYGSAGGLTSAGNQFWNQDSSGISGVAEENDRFGYSLTSGDFDGDGFDDLAIGVPREAIGSIVNAGSVNVIFGSTGGLTSTGNQLWHQDSPGILDTAENDPFGEEAFGSALAAGDFNGNGFDDLAIGVPGEAIGSIQAAGAVNVIYGSANRLTSAGNQFWNQNNSGILDSAEENDIFGWSLTSGDFNGNGFDDLAIGVPQEGIGSIYEAGAVNVIYGSANRLTSAGNQFWNQNNSGILDSAEENDDFGWSLTSGDFNGNGFDDLAIGVPHELTVIAGAVNVIYGSANRLTSAGNQFWNQNNSGILDSAEGGDDFGWSLTSGDFNGNGFDDLAIGGRGEDIGSIQAAGAVNVIYGSANRLTSAGNQFWNQNSPGILDAAEAFDTFGNSLTN